MSLLLALWLLQTPAAAGAPADCIVRTSRATYREPASLRALLSCQRKQLARWAADYQKQHGQEPPDAVAGRWDERQRAQVRDFLIRHPDLAALEADEPPTRDKTGRSGDKDLEALRQDLREMSDEGRKGITPEMAAKILNTIMDQQGFVSPDMTELLEAVQKDGANLTEGTVRKLKGAARQADAAGLDLGVKPDIKDFLLKEEEQKKESAKPSAPPNVD